MAERSQKLARQFSEVAVMASAESEEHKAARRRVDAVAPTAKHLMSLEPITKSFSTFMMAANIRMGLAGGAEECLDPSKSTLEQAGDLTRMMLSPNGRSSTLSKASETPSNINQDSEVPRAPPTAAPPGVLDGARKALDLRAVNLTSFCMMNAEWYYQKAKAVAEASKGGGHGTTRLGEYPIDPYECTREHVQWNLTAPHGPFDECSMKEHCMGRSMVDLPGMLKFTLKQYISPGARSSWERTGVKPEVDEHKQTHSPFCIIDLLAFCSAIADLNAANHEASGVAFPPFYNTAGREGGYSPSALCGFSTHKLSGVTRAFRKFMPGQFTVGKLVVSTFVNGLIQQEEVNALIEVDSLVGWKADFETDAKKVMWMVAPAPYEAPTTMPHRAPRATESNPATNHLVPTPRPTVDPRHREAEARRGVTHVLPRLPAPIGVASATHVVPPVPQPPPPPAPKKKQQRKKKAQTVAVIAADPHPPPAAPPPNLSTIRGLLSDILGYRVKIVPEN